MYTDQWRISEAAEPASSPPHLGDGLTRPLTVMLANAKFWSFYCNTWYSKYSKNDCHQWLSDRFRVHQIRFRPDPTGGAYSSPQSF